MKLYLSMFVLVALIFCGCQSKQTVSLASRKRPSIDTMAREQSAASTPIGSTAGLRETESIKVYGMNRYIDPADSRIMHERHAIYRLEQQPVWISRSPKYRNEVILGPIVGLKKADYAPEPLPGETSREIVHARRGVEQANDSINAVRESQQKLANSIESLAKGTAEAERKLTSVISILNERVKHLEADSGNVRDERTQAAQIESQDGGVVVRPSNQ
jgi:hypothetical protein